MKISNVIHGAVGIVLLSPLFAFAQIADGPVAGPFQDLLSNILVFTNTVLIPFIIGIGFLAFVWGMFRYFIAGGASEDSREAGKRLMINATIGFVVIIIFFGVINLFTTSIGLEGQLIDDIPQVREI
jgi:heme/copper-type cytochrome/quinol oxidase subunit 2